MAESDFLTGRLLVAMPGIDDPRFERAVVFVCSHDEDAAMGLAVNRPVDDLRVSDLLEKLGVPQAEDGPADFVLMGGPVQRERGFVLHTADYAAEGASVAITADLSLTATRAVLEAMTDYRTKPRRSVLALGYAGWDGGQLEQELRENVWLICDPDEQLLFGSDHEHKWSQALAKLGISADQLSGQAGRA